MALPVRQEWVRWRLAPARPRPLSWVSRYQRAMVAADAAVRAAGRAGRANSRFADASDHSLYVVTTAGLPLVWIAWVGMAGGYDPRFIGLGSEEYRRIINAAVSLTAAVAIVSYALKVDFARGYVLIALPGLGAADTAARYALRKRLHRQRRRGEHMRRVTVVGHAGAVADLIAQLRRDHYHGLEVVGVCLADRAHRTEVAGVPVTAGLDGVNRVVGETGSDTVAVLACPEMDGVALRRLAWELEKEGTDLCVAPALMDVAGPRTTIRPVAGLPLLHVDHAEIAGAKWVIKSVFDKAVATAALAVSQPAAGCHRRGHLGPGRRAGAVLADQDRQGRAAVHRPEVPHDGARRGTAPGGSEPP